MLATFDFVKEEYLTLRKEVESTVLELRQFERNCIIALALSFTWIATRQMVIEIALIAWFVPSLIPIYGALRSRAIEMHLDNLGAYLKTIEKAYIPANTVVGWEHHLSQNKSIPLRDASRRLWYILLLLSLAIGIIGVIQA